MLNHKLSKKSNLKRSHSVVQQNMMSQTKVTLILYMIIFKHPSRTQQ